MALVMLSDYPKTCDAVGSGHKKSGAGSSCIPHDRDRALWHAWTYAKDNGYISKEDKIPYAALLHVVREYDLAAPAEIPRSKEESLPRPVYKAALAVVEGLGYEHGRHHAQEKETAQNANASVSVDSDDKGLLSWEDIGSIFHDLNRQQKSEYLNDIVAKIDDEIAFIFDSQTEVLYYYDEQDGIYHDKAEHAVKKLMFDNIGMSTSTYWEAEIIDKLEVINKIDVETARDPQGYICFENGVYDVEARELLPHSPDRIFLNKWQVNYRPMLATKFLFLKSIGIKM
jgi:hypothetical protein